MAKGKGKGPRPAARPVISRDPKRLAANPDFLEHVTLFVEPPDWGGIPTPDFIDPDNPPAGFDFGPLPGDHPRFLQVIRFMEGNSREMPDGQSVEFWGFHDPVKNYDFPSDPIRVTEGQVFHCHATSMAKGGKHTIHWHGIEPDGHNDGVGKLSMEVGNPGYTYQWYAGAGGFYFYHCHRNTVLHFEMGMYGALLVDPLPPTPGDSPQPGHLGDPVNGPYFGYGYPLGGPGWVRRTDGVVRYDKEAIWVFDDVDPVWHTRSHGHALSTPNMNATPDANGNPLGVTFTAGGGLNIMDRKYFTITGVPHPWTRGDVAIPPQTPAISSVDVTVQVGQTLLARVLNAAYAQAKFTISAATLGATGMDPEVIAMDARVLGGPGPEQYSRPFVISSGVPFELSTARRFDMLFKPTAANIGDHLVRCEFLDSQNLQLTGIAETLIHVVPAP